MPTPKGTIIKILHDGDPVYAVVKEDLGKQVRVVYPYGAEFHDDVVVPKKECRKTSWAQDNVSFAILRQLAGIRYEGPKPTQQSFHGSPTKKYSPLPLPEPVQPLQKTKPPFTIQHPDLNGGQETTIDKVADPDGMLKAIEEGLGKFGATGIKWVDENKPDTPDDKAAS